MEYLDKTGLESLWTKVKEYLENNYATKDYVNEQIAKYHSSTT